MKKRQLLALYVGVLGTVVAFAGPTSNPKNDRPPQTAASTKPYLFPFYRL
ncbi:MAG: hypothetical protein K2W94_04530 [Alphaproteobacteria bacterium]|nr:hypothetical protein [Alphaproteobacteria bacterium]